MKTIFLYFLQSETNQKCRTLLENAGRYSKMQDVTRKSRGPYYMHGNAMVTVIDRGDYP